MTTRQPMKMTRTFALLALAATAFTSGSAVAARDPVITIVSGQASDPNTHDSVQSETACAISVFPSDKRQIEVISANDETADSGFFYNDATRVATVGASQMGWYFRERTTANPSPPWQHGRMVPGGPNAADIDVLWGDPGVAVRARRAEPDADGQPGGPACQVPGHHLHGRRRRPALHRRLRRRRLRVAARRRLRRPIAGRRQDVRHAALLRATPPPGPARAPRPHRRSATSMTGSTSPSARARRRPRPSPCATSTPARRGCGRWPTGSPPRPSHSSTPTPARWARSVTINRRSTCTSAFATTPPTSSGE